MQADVVRIPAVITQYMCAPLFRKFERCAGTGHMCGCSAHHSLGLYDKLSNATVSHLLMGFGLDANAVLFVNLGQICIMGSNGGANHRFTTRTVSVRAITYCLNKLAPPFN